ncbi:MAG: M17 family peptidase N-terminal domain-containing protein, partial [Thermomicrobiales bacterium]
MNITIKAIDPFETASDALIIPVPAVDGAASLEAIPDPRLREQIAPLLEDGKYTGKAGSTYLVSTLGTAAPKRLVLAGVGDPANLSGESIRKAWGSAIIRARDAGAKDVVSLMPPTSETVSDKQALGEAVSAIGMATYTYTSQQGVVKNAKPVVEVSTVTFASARNRDKALTAALNQGISVSAAVNLSRDVTNEP